MQGAVDRSVWCEKELKRDHNHITVNIGMYHHVHLIHGDGIRDWRREAENVNEEDWDGGKAGDEGPVTGGVVVR